MSLWTKTVFTQIFFLLTVSPFILFAQDHHSNLINYSHSQEELKATRNLSPNEIDSIKNILRTNHQTFYTDKTVNRDYIWVAKKAEPAQVMASCSNIDFESGSFAGWTSYTGYNYTFNHFDSPVLGQAGGDYAIVSGNGQEGCWPNVFDEVAPAIPGMPRGKYSAKLGERNKNGAVAERIEQTFTVSQSSSSFTYQYAIVFEFPNHPAINQPYFEAIMLAPNGDTIPCSHHYFFSSSGIPGFTIGTSGNCNGILVKPWETVSVDLRNYIGQNVTIRFTNGDCTLGGHYSMSFIDGSCMERKIDGPAACNAKATGDSLFAPPGGYTYLWSPGGQTTDRIFVTTPGTYTVTMENFQGCGSDITFKYDTAKVLSAASTLFNNVTCYGAANGNATATVNAGASPYSYSWSTTPSQNNAQATGLSPGTYSVLVTDNNGCSNTLSVSITQPPDIIHNETSANITCGGLSDGSASTTVTAGDTPYTYTWAGTGTTTSSITGLKAGTYTVTISDKNNCTKTTSIQLTEPPVINTVITPQPTHCALSDGSANAVVSGGSNTFTYSWNTSPAQTTAMATGLIEGNYTLVVIDSKGCSDTSIVTINKQQNISLQIVSSVNPKCFGACDGNIVSSAGGGNAPYSYTWNTNPIQNTASATGLCAGTHEVIVKDASGCLDTISYTLTEPVAVITNVSPDVLLCIGQSTNLTANASGGTTPYSYSWSNGNLSSAQTVQPTTATTYTVAATDANGCKGPDVVVQVNLNPPLDIVTAGDKTYCSGTGGTNTLTATASGGNSNYTYTWLPGSQSTSSITVNPTQTTTYTVLVNDGCGTPADTGYVTIGIRNNPVAIFTAPDTTGCAPVCVEFQNLSDPSLIAHWDFGDGKTDGSFNIEHCYNNPGVYTVSLNVTDQYGCTASSVHPNMVEAYDYPVAEFTATPNPISILDPVVQFKDQSIDATTWYWYFGDGDSLNKTTPNPKHEYSTETTTGYNVTLDVYNIHGCKSTITHHIEVEPQWSFYIPNTFTPNGDGKNDYFIGKAVGVSNFKMYIYDRWGNEIFISNDINNPWDGRVQGGGGNIVQEDTYVWIITLEDVFNKQHRYVGHVNVVK